MVAALNVLDGQAIGQCRQHDMRAESLQFLRKMNRETSGDRTLYLIAGNYAARKHPEVRKLLVRHARVRMHFAPICSLWLNLVERVFCDISENRIQHGNFASVRGLVTTIREHITEHNRHARSFIGNVRADRMLAKIASGRAKATRAKVCK